MTERCTFSLKGEGSLSEEDREYSFAFFTIDIEQYQKLTKQEKLLYLYIVSTLYKTEQKRFDQTKLLQMVYPQCSSNRVYKHRLNQLLNSIQKKSNLHVTSDQSEYVIHKSK